MMKRSFRDAWSAELRSGRHVQGRTYLYNNGKECCIGVRCGMDVDEGNMKLFKLRLVYDAVRRFVEVGEPNKPKTTPYYSTSTPHPTTLERWGLTHQQSKILIDMNDKQQKTFEEIADYLDSLPVEDD